MTIAHQARSLLASTSPAGLVAAFIVVTPCLTACPEKTDAPRDASMTAPVAHADAAKIDGANRDGTNLDGTKLDGTNRDGTNRDGTNRDGTKLDGVKANAPSAPPEGSVSFVFPQEGSKVFTELDVAFGVSGFKLRPAGEDATDKTTGHHHLIIDGEPIPAGAVVPMDGTHLHFGKAQTEAHVKLTPGKHTLTMQLADGAHRSYGPSLAATLHIEAVEKPAKLGVSFAEPADAAKVKKSFKVKFHVDGFSIKPVGETPLDKTTGHHHLVIDGGPVALGTVIPADDTHLHYGKGQTEAMISLSPGTHTLTLQFGDGAHISYGAGASATIHVDVEN